MSMNHDSVLEFSAQRLSRARRLARSAWGMTILLCIALVVIVGTALLTNYRAHLATARERVAATALVTGQSINMAIESVGNALYGIATHIRHGSSRANAPDFMVVQEDSLHMVRHLILINPLGRVLTSSPEIEGLRGQDLGTEGYFRIHQKIREELLYLGQPVQVEGRMFMPLSRAVRHQDGTLLAVIVALLDPERLSAVISAARQPSGSVLQAILQFDGTVIASSPASLAAPGTQIGPQWSFGKEASLVVQQGVGNWPLVVEVGMSQRDVLATFKMQAVLWLGLIVMMIALLALATRIYVQQLLRTSLQASVIERQNVELRSNAESLRREVEERRHAERQRDSFFNLSADLLAIVDQDGRFVSVNPAFAAELNETEAALRGIDLTSYLHQDEVDGFRRALESMEVGGGARALEARCQTANGYRWFLWTLVARDRYIFAVAHDFSEQRAASDALREAKEAAELANETKTQFLANMSHELRTPLNAIIGFSETLDLGIVGQLEPKQHEYVRDIHRAGEHLLGIVADLLDLSVIDSGAMILTERVTHIPEVINAAFALVRPKAEEAEVILGIRMPPQLPDLRVDAGKIRQILVNLLGNAIKFTPKDGRVTVNAAIEPINGGFTLEVVDTGIGIKPTDIPQVLSPFGQLKSAYARAHGGVGLGLPLARRLAELHGGDISITSEPGKGTTVRLWLPPERIVSLQERTA